MEVKVPAFWSIMEDGTRGLLLARNWQWQAQMKTAMRNQSTIVGRHGVLEELCVCYLFQR